MECYDHVTDKWTSLSAPRQNRHSHCSMSLNGYLYVIGGKFMAFLLKSLLVLLRVTRGARNPDLQVATTHAR